MNTPACKQTKISTLYTVLKQHNLEGLLVSSPANISYITDYKSRDSCLIISKKKNLYITDFRYTKEAQKALNGAFAVKQANGLLVNSSIADFCKQMDIANLGFEEEYLSFAQYQRLKKTLAASINLVPTRYLIEKLREIKTSEELLKIRRSTEITINALRYIKNLIVPGISEIEIAGELERFIRYSGGTGASFDIIAASGPNSSFPHHISTNRKAAKNEPVLIDIGVNFSGYKSDLTRVFFLGKITTLTAKVYDIVAQAQNEAIRKIKPGTSISEIDAAARKYIKQKGYGSYFGHNLGHGIGLEVHELPNISAGNTEKLKKGMIFTIEPAIYIPGKFGIRIEDTVSVTQEGVDVLSGALNK